MIVAKKPLILMLVKRAVIFMATMSAVVLFLYGIGTAQNFLESTQLLLLNLLTFLGILLAVASMYGLFVHLVLALVMKSKEYTLTIIIYFTCILLGIALIFFSSGILVFVGGNIR